MRAFPPVKMAFPREITAFIGLRHLSQILPTGIKLMLAVVSCCRPAFGASHVSTMIAPTTIRAPLDGSHYQVVVIGGGINGVAIARQCAASGRRTLLVEQKRFRLRHHQPFHSHHSRWAALPRTRGDRIGARKLARTRDASARAAAPRPPHAFSAGT